MQNNKVMVFIVYNRAIDEEMRDLLNDLNIRYFTRWVDVTGVGTKGPNFGDHVWPALNNVVMIVIEEEIKDDLSSAINNLRDRFPAVGLKAFVLPVIDVI